MRKAAYIFIISIGLLQAVGFVLNSKEVRGLGMATCSSPLPIVFTEVRGVETFASDFFIRYTGVDGEKAELQITPEMYSKLRGPYNRRNIYGAAISYGPVLPEELWQTVLSYGICNNILQEEMQLPAGGKDHSIRIKTRTAGRNDEWILKPRCN